VVSSLKRGADCLRMVQLMPLHPKILSSLSSFVSFNSRLVLPFWYRLTQVVLDKRPLSGCSSRRRSSSISFETSRRPGLRCPGRTVVFVQATRFAEIPAGGTSCCNCPRPDRTWRRPHGRLRNNWLDQLVRMLYKDSY